MTDPLKGKIRSALAQAWMRGERSVVEQAKRTGHIKVLEVPASMTCAKCGHNNISCTGPNKERP